MMETDSFRHEYDLGALTLVRPRGHDFAMLVTPRYRHHYEAQEYECCTARFISRVLHRHSLFIDVGANYGFYTLLASTQHSNLEVIALEPVGTTFEILRRNVESLALGNVHLHQLAAAERDGTASFQISMAADNCGFSPHPAAPPLRQVEVRTARLDTLLAGRPPGPALVKIDVEGHELAVLRGMRETFTRLPDLSLLVEFNPEMQEAAGAKPEDLLQELDRLGFAIFLLDDERCRPYRLRADSNWRSWLSRLGYANLYCVRQEAAVALCLFSHTSQLGGAERFLLELVEELVADYGVVCSVVLPGPGPLAEALEKAGACCLLADYGWWGVVPPQIPTPETVRRLVPQLQALLRDVLPAVWEMDPDLVWTQTLVIPWGATTAALLNKPHIWSVLEYGERDHGIQFFAPFSEVIEDIAGCSTLVYVCGQALGETLFGSISGANWRVLYPNIRLPEGAAKPTSTGLFRREGAIRLGVFATLQEGKGQEDAIRALAELVGEGCQVELLLAGVVNPTYWARLAALIAQHHLEDYVRVPGFLNDRLAAMRETDIILVCSRQEAFGRVGLEGMLLGKPVVYASAGGLLEYMVDGRTGIAYPPGDAHALAGAIRQLLADPLKRARLGAEAQSCARSRCSREAYGGEVYRTLCDLRNKRPVQAKLPRSMQPLLGPALSALAAQIATQAQQAAKLEVELQIRTCEAQAATTKVAELQQAVASVEEWQQSWFKRAFHRWRSPGTSGERVGPLRKLERSLRKRRKRLTVDRPRSGIGRFLTRQAKSVGKRSAELRQLAVRLAVWSRCSSRLRELHAARKLICDSGLFDAQWYFQRYPEARVGGADPVLHYLLRGARSGCDPNPFFDTRWYLTQDPEAASSGLNPLEYYLRFGAVSGRSPGPHFNAAWYITQFPEAAGPGTTPLGHYLRHGHIAGSRPAPDAGLAPSSRYADFSVPFAPKITVIVPNYNHAPYLRQRLDSIFNQTYPHFTVILLDDASTDESSAILQEFGRRFPDRTELVINETNSGSPFTQWKRGLARARTELVWIAESDDFCEANFLETLVPFFRDEAVQIAYCPTDFVDSDGRQLEFSFDAYTSALDNAKWKSVYVETAHREVNSALGIRNTIPNVSSALLRHPGSLALLDDPAWLSMRICGDWVFYLHHARGGKIAYSPQTRNSYRYHPSNASRKTYKLPVYYREHECVARTMVRLYRVGPAVLERQRQFLREHWDHVFKADGPPAFRFEEVYDLGRVEAHASERLPNVLVVGYDFATGGGEIFAIRLAAALRDKGFGVTFFDFNGQPENPEFRRLLPSAIPAIQRRESADINDIIRDFGIEIVHTHHACTDDYFATGLASSSDRPAQIVTMHGMYEAMPEESQQLVKLMPLVDHWVYVAEKNLLPFQRHGLHSPARFTKIAYGMQKPAVTPIHRATLGIPEDAFVICVASRALPEKGWRESILAVDRARKITGRELHLMLLGDGPICDLLARQGTPPYVHLLGFKPNPMDYYAMADLGLLATKFRSECRPLTLMECLLTGRPVVATDVGEIRSMLTAPNGKLAGTLVALQNWEIPVLDLASAICRLAQDNAAYREAASIAESCGGQFDIGKIVQDYAELYRRVLTGRRVV